MDSSDIPLNISRETFQDNRVIQKMKNILIKQVLGLLQDIAKNIRKSMKSSGSNSEEY
ncbi:hypothetical protein [Candidatus Kuenenia stuttgartiensis]|uniref:hypothetical protein n=1 Tax=Kuenenia stuttgartiensis TaxID=174633 RepID=UPI0012FF1D21